MDWHGRALCAGAPNPDQWFPTAPRGRTPAGALPPDAHAAALCHGCEVQAECLEDALATNPHDDHGIRGGTTSKARAQLRNRMRATA